MKKSRAFLGIISFIILAVLAISVSLPAMAESAVVSTDWIASSGLDLKKCTGEECAAEGHKNCDYVYSFAVVGDTQNLNFIDVSKDKNYVYGLYNWIAENQESKNIKYVLGLGDITQSYSRTYRDGAWINEWINVGEAISLLDGKIGYSLVRGNHDLSDAKDGFNGVFGAGDKLTNGVDNQYYEDLLKLSLTYDNKTGLPMAGFRNPDKIEDTYRKIEVDGHKYIIFTLDWHPTKAGDSVLADGETDALTWLDSVLRQNPDYKAIVTLHSFIYYDGTLTDITEDRFPIENLDGTNEEWEEVSEVSGNAAPKEIWDVLKTHENVEMILCGHMDVDDIITTQLVGDKGNTVTCMLIDGQTIDKQIEPVGLVAMFYISADGSVMNVEYISTVRDNAGNDAYLKAKNQFRLELDIDEWVELAGGYIPKAEYDAHTFQVMLDDDSDSSTQSTYFGGFDTWDETLNAIHAFNGYNPVDAGIYKTYTIKMTKDYEFTKTGLTHNKAGSCPSNTVLDLDGNKFTLASATVFLPYYNGTARYSPSFTVINGDIEIKGSAKLIRAQHGHVNATGGQITLNLEDLNITYASGATNSLISNSDGSTGGPSNFKFNITNCNIDASKAAALTLFTLKDTNSNSNVALTIKGGSIKGATTDTTVLFSQNWPGDTVSFVKNSSGSYTTVSYTDNGRITGVFGSGEENKYLEFTAPTEGSGVYTSTLTASLAVVTEYGVIPSGYASVADYPFVLFKGGVGIYAFSDWRTFIDTDLKANSEYCTGCTLLLRRDYSTSDASGSPWAFRFLKDITIDLGNNTITRGSRHLFNLISQGSADTETYITIINGTIKSTSGQMAPITFNNDSNSTSTAKYFVTLEGVTLDLTSGKGMIGSTCNSSYKTGKTVSTVTFNECTFLRGDKTASMKLFNLEQEANMTDTKVVINGGKLISDTAEGLSSLTFADFNAGNPSPDSIEISDSFRITLPANIAAPDKLYELTAGDFCLAKYADNPDGTASYTLCDARLLETEYGRIKADFASIEAYPFVLFKDGVNLHGFLDWEIFIDAEMTKNSEFQSGCTLLLRRDYTTSETAKDCWAISFMRDIQIDLGGNVLTRGNTHLFNAISHGAKNTTTEITIFNGTLTADLTKADGKSTSAAICFNNDGKSTSTDTYIFNLNGLTLDISSGRGLISTFNNGTETSRVSATVNYNNCTVSRGDATGSITLFNLKDDNNRNDISVNINGGSIVADSTLDGVNFATYNDEREAGKGSPDSFTFGKYNGKYTTVIIPKGTNAPANDFGGLKLVKDGEDGTTATYILVPTASIGLDFTPKASVTLDSNLIFNIYIPTHAGLGAVTLNGTAVTLGEAKDGYYLIATPLKANNAAEELKLTVELTVDGTPLKGSFTFSTVKYAQKLLAMDITNQEKTLIKDMLAYINSAYEYFNDGETVAEIVALLNGYVSGKVINTADAKCDTDGLSGATLVLGATPAIRFYLDGYTADKFSFKVGERALSASEATTGSDTDGSYIEFTLFAYEMTETFTYEIEGTEITGEYNIISYYADAVAKSDTALADIVAKFYNYCESAVEYKTAVTAE